MFRKKGLIHFFHFDTFIDGCYNYPADNKTKEVIMELDTLAGDYNFTHDYMDTNLCSQKCYATNMTYALVLGRLCTCAAGLVPISRLAGFALPSRCNIPCSANKDNKCGGLMNEDELTFGVSIIALCNSFNYLLIQNLIKIKVVQPLHDYPKPSERRNLE